VSLLRKGCLKIGNPHRNWLSYWYVYIYIRIYIYVIIYMYISNTCLSITGFWSNLARIHGGTPFSQFSPQKHSPTGLEASQGFIPFRGQRVLWMDAAGGFLSSAAGVFAWHLRPILRFGEWNLRVFSHVIFSLIPWHTRGKISWIPLKCCDLLRYGLLQWWWSYFRITGRFCNIAIYCNILYTFMLRSISSI
jgi:hypothetical protein